MKNQTIYVSTLQTKFYKTQERLEKALLSRRFESWTSRRKNEVLNRLQRYARNLRLPLRSKLVAALLAAGVFMTPAEGISQLTVALRTGAENPLSSSNVDNGGGGYSKPSFLDLDGDADLDLFSGKYYSNNSYFIRSGTSAAPIFSAVVEFSGETLNRASPAFFDYDNDGDPDIFVGIDDGTIPLIPCPGATSTTCPRALAPLTQYHDKSVEGCPDGFSNPLSGKDVGSNASPVFVDIDSDGDKDLFVGNGDGNILYFKNTGTLGNPAFSAQTSTANPFNGVDVGSDAAPTLSDIDGDGDFDALIGRADGTLVYYKNIGTQSNPVFTLVSGASDPFSSIDVGQNSAPVFTNLDGDANLDLIIGNYAGDFIYYEAVNATLPVSWLDFSTQRIGSGVALNWRTASETNTLDFIVQHSADGLSWSDVGSVNAAGNSVQVSTYRFIHNHPATGSNYYRLRQRDKDGNGTYSEIRSLVFGPGTDHFSVTNILVVNGVINVVVNGARELQLFNGIGQLVQTFAVVNGTQQLQVKSSGKGIHYLRTAYKTEKIFIQ